MSRLELKAQLAELEGNSSAAAAQPQRRAKGARRGETKPAKKTISRAEKRQATNPLDQLRKEARDHTHDNVAALTRRGGKKHREKTDKLAKKLVAMRSKRKNNAADTSGDDSDGDGGAGVDMWQVLRQMKARGL